MRLPRPLLVLALLASSLAAQDTLVIDLKPGGGFPGSGFKTTFDAIPLGGRLLFTGEDETSRALWITDGTAEGTAQVHPVFNPHDYTPLGDEVYFLDNTTDFGGVWKTDGTTAGTVKLTPDGIVGYNLTVFQGEAYFTVRTYPNTDLWKTDGTPAGTAPVASLGTILPTNDPLTVFQDQLHFFGGTHGVYGYNELWRTDGTPGGEVLLQHFPHPLAAPADLTVFQDALFFTVLDAYVGRELWTSDGTPGGTGVFADLTPGTAGTNPENLVVLDGGYLLFTDFQGLFGPERQLWSTDGTVAGTQVIAGGVLEVASVGATGYYFAGFSLWSTDGTASGSQLIGTPLVYSQSSGITEPYRVGDGDELVFRAQDFDSSDDNEVWFTDGTQLALLADVYPGSPGSYSHSFTRVGGTLFFGADDGVTGHELHAVPITELGAWVGSSFGQGCGATLATLSLSGEATLGGTPLIELAGAPPLSPATLFWSPEYVAQDLGGGCTTYLGEAAIVLQHATDGTGGFAVPIAIPDLPVLAGLTLYLQDFIAASGGALLGVGELSGGLEVVVGP
ncbi:MAG: hypothetical protein AAF682_19940 [Planctomycetota bacterium]